MGCGSKGNLILRAFAVLFLSSLFIWCQESPHWFLPGLPEGTERVSPVAGPLACFLVEKACGRITLWLPLHCPSASWQGRKILDLPGQRGFLGQDNCYSGVSPISSSHLPQYLSVEKGCPRPGGEEECLLCPLCLAELPVSVPAGGVKLSCGLQRETLLNPGWE